MNRCFQIIHSAIALTFPLVLVTLLLFVFTGCDRRKVHDPNSYEILLNIDWRESNLTPNGNTILVYNADNGRLFLSDYVQENSTAITLPEGRYTILVFNEMMGDFHNITFSDENDLKSLKALSVPNKSKFNFIKSDDAALFNMPEILATARLENILISRKTPKSTTYTMVPKRVTTHVQVIAKIKNMHSLASSGNYTLLSGVSEGISLYDNSAVGVKGSHLASLNNITFDVGSTTDGTMTSNFSTFGFHKISGDKPEGSAVSVYLKLRNGADFPTITRDITTVKFLAGKHEILIIITIEGIVLPPDIPSIGDGGGLEVEMGEWEDYDEKIIDLI